MLKANHKTFVERYNDNQDEFKDYITEEQIKKSSSLREKIQAVKQNALAKFERETPKSIKPLIAEGLKIRERVDKRAIKIFANISRRDKFDSIPIVEQKLIKNGFYKDKEIKRLGSLRDKAQLLLEKSKNEA